MSAAVADGTIGGGCAGSLGLAWKGSKPRWVAMVFTEPKGLPVLFAFGWLAPKTRLDPPLPKGLAGGGGGPMDALDDAGASMVAG